MSDVPDPRPDSPVFESLSFGVGCFRFTYWDDAATNVTSEQILKAVQAALEALPAVNDVEIDPAGAPDEFDMAGEPRPALDAGDEVVSPRAVQLDFDVYIPRRVQDAIVGRAAGEPEPRTGPEHFRVHIRYSFYGEVAFVVPLGESDENNSPSDSVRIVREFLSENFKDPTGRVKFETLGPSPFHADFYVTLGKVDDGRGFALETARPRGYADLHFTANADMFESVIEAADALFFDLGSELDDFYEIVRLRVEGMREWARLAADAESILEDRKDKSVAKVPVRQQIAHLSKLMDALARFELNEVYRAGSVAKIERELDDTDEAQH